MTNLVPQGFFKNFPKLRPFSSFSRLPSIWEDVEDLGGLLEEQTGLTVYEDQKNVYVETALPGLKPGDIEITLDKGVLWIRGEQKEEEENKEKKYYRKAQRSFSYRVTLPSQIDEAKEPQATYKDGIMKVTFVKSKQSQAKKISVKGA